MTCLHSSDGMGDTWTRKPSLTVRWLLISPESRRGMSNIIIIKALIFKQFNSFMSLVFLLIVTCAISNGCSFLLSYAFSAEGVMRTMTTEKLLKGMPVLQTQIDTLLEFDVSQMLTRLLHLLDRCSITRQEVPLLFLLAGSSQGAEQRDHQCCIYASLQGPGQTVCILQWRNHQPIRLVVLEELLIYTTKM